MRLAPRVLVIVVLVGSVSASCLGGSSHSATTTAAQALVVSCDQIIIERALPPAGYRRVLGVISAPPAYIAQVVSNPGGPWPYMEKVGMVIRASRSPVTVTVPRTWQARAAISWGSGGPVSSLRFSACPSPANVWNHYAGGFFLSSHGACVPLLFQVGERRELVRFGIHHRCR